MSDRGHLRIVASRREPLLVGSGGGPHDPGMEARVAVLEQIAKETREGIADLRTEMRAIRADVGALRTEVSYIRGRLESLPSTWQMISTVMAGNLGLAGVLFAAVKLFGH